MDIREKIDNANEKAVNGVKEADPVWVDIQTAGEILEGYGDHTVLHSGPPIDYKDMTDLHKRTMIYGSLFEGWAKTEKEADEMLKAGEIKVDSALNYNSVGGGTGVITPSIALIVVEDRVSKIKAATFPAEGPFQGGLCTWGLYSPEIAQNLRYMRDELFPIMREMIDKRGGLPLKPILAESLQLGDENHTRQVAADLLYVKQIIPDLVRMDIPKDKMLKVMDYIVDTPRFFHCYGQSAARASLLTANDLQYSTMVTAFGGNGVEFGIKVAGLGEEWFTAPAPMAKGRYTSSKFTDADQLPWTGDSCVVECAGMGGIASAASPIVCNLRGVKLNEAIAITKEMQKICISKNYNFPIPNLDFDLLPIGIDIRKVLKTGISPLINGGMFNYQGGLIGAGSARIPMLCFEKAMKAFAAKYRNS